jgi:hypothetical protein
MSNKNTPPPIKRLIVSFWDICLDNFPDGQFTKRKLDTDEAAKLINHAIETKSLLAVSDKDLAAPYQKDALKKAKELCGVLQNSLDINLSLEMFFSVFDGEDENEKISSIVPLQLAQIAPEHPMIVVSCMYMSDNSIKTGAPRYCVAPDSVSFYMFEAT